MIGLQHYLTLSAMLFVLSIAGIIINRRNLILILMCINSMHIKRRMRLRRLMMMPAILSTNSIAARVR